jgi:predicted patatin/cPLA2 family phospholipase
MGDRLPRTALIAEGGGQRGIFTAGVLDSWLVSRYNPFELLIGTSAGAQNLSSFMSGQSGYGHQAITELTRDRRFFKVGHALKRQSTMDLDWYFDEINRRMPLNLGCAHQRLEGRRLLFSATSLLSRSAVYFEPNSNNWFELLKASSALPFLYRDGVAIDGDTYVDGGLADPLPVLEAYRRGARQIVVIRTMPKAYDASSPWAERIRSWVCRGSNCPRPIDYLVQHQRAYQEALDFIASPPKGVIVEQIFPSETLSSRLIGSTPSQLRNDYLQGIDAGKFFLSSVKRSEYECVSCHK